MSNNKSFAPSKTNRSNREQGSIHIAVYILRLIYNHVPSHWETLFLNGRGPLYQILLCRLSRNRAWYLIYHILYFLLTLYFQGSARNSIFANIFHLWYLSCLNIFDGLIHTTGRVIITLDKWMVTQSTRNGY